MFSREPRASVTFALARGSWRNVGETKFAFTPAIVAPAGRAPIRDEPE